MNLSMLVELLTHLPPSKDAYVPGCSLVAAAPGLPLELAVALGCSQERPAVPGWPLEVAAAPDQPQPRALHEPGGVASPTASNDGSGARL